MCRKVADGFGEEVLYFPEGKRQGEGKQKQAVSDISKGISKIKAGGYPVCAKGTYKENLVIPAKCSGKKGAYITISNYGNEKAVISGKSKKSPVLLTVKGAAYLKITGLEFADATGQDACGISVTPGSNHLIISNNTVHDIAVKNPYQQDHCANGILLYGDSAKKSIHNVLIYGNKLYDCQTGWAECISVTANCRNINIVQNTIDNTGNIGIRPVGKLWLLQ